MVMMPEGAVKQPYPHEQGVADALKIAHIIKASGQKFSYVYGLSRGGSWLAVRLSHLLGLPVYEAARAYDVVMDIHCGEISADDILVVDDIADTGAQLQQFQDAGCFIATLFYHKDSTVIPNIWIQEKIGERKKVWIIFETWEADPLE